MGTIEKKSCKLLCDFMIERAIDNLKTFVNNNINPGTYINTDCFPEYSFLDDPNESVGTHKNHTLINLW